MQAFLKQIPGGSPCSGIAHRVIRKDGCSGEAEYLVIVKEPFNAFIRLPKLTAVAFIKDEHDTASHSLYFNTAKYISFDKFFYETKKAPEGA